MSGLNKGLVAGLAVLVVAGAAYMMVSKKEAEKVVGVIGDGLTVVSWGGAYTKSQVEAYHKPWMAKTKNAIVSEDYGGGIAEIKAQRKFKKAKKS